MTTPREKGRILENLTSSVLSLMNIKSRNVCYDNRNTNRSGEKYCDHITEHMDIEDKYYSCRDRGYKIDSLTVYNQIISRFNGTNKIRVCIIADPLWTSNARDLLNFNGIHIISLNTSNIEKDLKDCTRKIIKGIAEILLEHRLYCNISNSWDDISNSYCNISNDWDSVSKGYGSVTDNIPANNGLTSATTVGLKQYRPIKHVRLRTDDFFILDTSAVNVLSDLVRGMDKEFLDLIYSIDWSDNPYVLSMIKDLDRAFTDLLKSSGCHDRFKLLDE